MCPFFTTDVQLCGSLGEAPPMEAGLQEEAATLVKAIESIKFWQQGKSQKVPYQIAQTTPTVGINTNPSANFPENYLRDHNMAVNDSTLRSKRSRPVCCLLAISSSNSRPPRAALVIDCGWTCTTSRTTPQCAFSSTNLRRVTFPQFRRCIARAYQTCWARRWRGGVAREWADGATKTLHSMRSGSKASGHRHGRMNLSQPRRHSSSHPHHPCCTSQVAEQSGSWPAPSV